MLASAAGSVSTLDRQAPPPSLPPWVLHRALVASHAGNSHDRSHRLDAGRIDDGDEGILAIGQRGSRKADDGPWLGVGAHPFIRASGGSGRSGRQSRADLVERRLVDLDP
jgi:hypothetical protein